MVASPSDTNPYQSPTARDSAVVKPVKLALGAPLAFAGAMPAVALAKVHWLRYRGQVNAFEGLAIGFCGWGLWQLWHDPHHPLAYGAIVLSVVLETVFAIWPRVHVYRYRNRLRGVSQQISGVIEPDGVRIADAAEVDRASGEQELVPWSLLSLALVDREHAVLFRSSGDQTELLIFAKEMFKDIDDWRRFRKELDRAYKPPEPPQPTIRRQVLRGVRWALIYIALFAIAIFVALSLRNR
jgi:hypothetical protein